MISLTLAVGPPASSRLPFLHSVAALVPATMVARNEVDLDGRQIDAVISPPLHDFTSESQEKLSAALVENVADHPVIAHYQRTGDGRPYAISDFLTRAAYHQTGIYRPFYRHLGAEDQLSFVLPDPRLVIGIALNRNRRGFSTRDRQVCNLLRPHLLQAYRHVEASTQMRRLASSFQRAAAEHGLGAIRLDHEGQPTETSPTRKLGLTKREAEVLELVVRHGLATKRIAAARGISRAPRTSTSSTPSTSSAFAPASSPSPFSDRAGRTATHHPDRVA